MKRLLFVLLLLPVISFADTYDIGATWNDPTPTGPGYTPVYDVEYQVATNPVIPVNDLTNPAFSASNITATPGDEIKLRVRARNTQGGTGNWSVWYTAGANYPPTQPDDQGAVTFTVIRTGP